MIRTTAESEGHARHARILPQSLVELERTKNISLDPLPSFRDDRDSPSFDSPRLATFTSLQHMKRQTRPFRKMGHVTIVNENMETARQIAQEVKNTIRVVSE